MRPRFLALGSLLFLGVVAACGGKQIGVNPDGGDFKEPDGATCVDIVLSSYDRSCTTTADCVDITSGIVCSGSCACGGSTVNKSGQARYEAALSGLSLEACPCVANGEPACVKGTCTLCAFDSDEPGCNDGGFPILDSGGGKGGPDAGRCVDVKLSSYDRSCTTSKDCISITSGELCDGTCECGGSTINQSGEAAYEKAISGVKFGACECPFFGDPECVHGQCALCGAGSSTPECPDGG